MSYTLMGSAATDIMVQFGTDEEIAENIGGDATDDTTVRLVLNDGGNQIAYVIHGTPQEWVALANRIINGATSVSSARSKAGS